MLYLYFQSSKITGFDSGGASDYARSPNGLQISSKTLKLDCAQWKEVWPEDTLSLDIQQVASAGMVPLSHHHNSKLSFLTGTHGGEWWCKYLPPAEVNRVYTILEWTSVQLGPNFAPIEINGKLPLTSIGAGLYMFAVLVHQLSEQDENTFSEWCLTM